MELSFSPADIASRYADIGVGKARRPLSHLTVLGILAGVLIALGGAATNAVVYGVQDPWMIKLICGLLFPFGLGMVVIMGAELFTGNCLMGITLLEKRCTFLQMIRSWAVVYLARHVRRQLRGECGCGGSCGGDCASCGQSCSRRK